MKLIPINSENMANCHKINEDNVPEVGTKSLSEFESLVNNSDFNLCVLIEDIVVIYENYTFDTEVLVASVRTKQHLIDAAVIGAHRAVAKAVVKSRSRTPRLLVRRMY